MNEWIKPLLENAPAAAALLVAITMFLRHITEENKASRELWSNHMSKQSDRLAEVALTLKEIAVILRVNEKSRGE